MPDVIRCHGVIHAAYLEKPVQLVTALDAEDFAQLKRREFTSLVGCNRKRFQRPAVQPWTRAAEAVGKSSRDVHIHSTKVIRHHWSPAKTLARTPASRQAVARLAAKSTYAAYDAPHSAAARSGGA